MSCLLWRMQRRPVAAVVREQSLTLHHVEQVSSLMCIPSLPMKLSTHHGNALCVDAFNGEEQESRFGEWLSSHEQVQSGKTKEVRPEETFTPSSYNHANSCFHKGWIFRWWSNPHSHLLNMEMWNRVNVEELSLQWIQPSPLPFNRSRREFTAIFNPYSLKVICCHHCDSLLVTQVNATKLAGKLHHQKEMK